MSIPSLAQLSGWGALAVVLAAGMVPLVTRLRMRARAAVHSPPMRVHIALGLTTTAAAAAHTLTALTALGSPEVVGAGTLALLPGALAFLVVIAHVGIGLQLREPKLRDRVRKRRLHLVTASTLLVLVAAHAGLLLRG
jgi:hypothetical protein